MEFQFGDVVMFMGHAYFVVDFDDDMNLLVLTDGFSTTSEVDYEDVVKIGHDDTFEQNILDRLKNVVNVVRNHKDEVQNNQINLVKELKCLHLKSYGMEYTVTGNTKEDGTYLYCQIYSDKGYEWILVEELLDKFFK